MKISIIILMILTFCSWTTVNAKNSPRKPTYRRCVNKNFSELKSKKITPDFFESCQDFLEPKSRKNPPEKASEHGLYQEETDTSILTNITEIRKCYERELKKNSNLEGLARVKFSVEPNGYVSHAQIMTNTLDKHRRVAKCLKNLMLKTVFPKPRGGKFVSITYPFVFHPR